MTPLATHRLILRVTARTAGIGTADMISQGSRALLMVAPVGWTTATLLLLEIGRNGLLLGFGLALVLELREASALRDDRLRRRLAVAAAAVAVVATSTLLTSAEIGVRLGLVASAGALRMHNWWNNAMVGIIALAYLSRRRESMQAEQSGRDAAERLAQARRRLDSVAVRTAQSRFDPQMIVDCLVRARDVYPSDRAAGDALLARLTRCLRLTLDIASGGEPTVRAEAELAAARSALERRDGGPGDAHV